MDKCQSQHSREELSHPPSEVLVLTPLRFPQCAGEENWVDNRTIYVGHKEPPPGADAYIPQRYPDNRIVSAKVTSLSLLTSFVEHWDFLTAVSNPKLRTAFIAAIHSRRRAVIAVYTGLVNSLSLCLSPKHCSDLPRCNSTFSPFLLIMSWI